MINNIKFSIIVPNYNKAEYIEDCLSSIFNQTYNNYEVIFIDDGSTDNSVEIAQKYNINLLHTKHIHAGGARNKGLENATGDYIIFLDSDDYFTDNLVLEKLANQINDEDIIFLTYTRDDFGKTSLVEETKNDISYIIENTRNLGCPTKCFKKSLLEGLKFPECKRYEDINFALEAMCKAKKYSFFKDSFFTYRKTPSSNTTTEVTGDAMLDILEELVKMHRLCLKYPKYKINLIKRIKRDRLKDRLDILEHLIEFDENKFKEYFN